MPTNLPKPRWLLLATGFPWRSAGRTRRSALLIVALTTAGGLASLAAWATEPTASMPHGPEAILGVVEEAPVPGAAAKWSKGLRVAFRRHADGWAPACESKAGPPWESSCRLPKAGSRMAWNVSLAGRSLGVVTTAGWMSEKWYSQEGLLRIVSRKIPQAGLRSPRFAGWVQGDVSHPLPAIHDGHPPREPSRWAPVRATEADKRQVFALFVDRVPSIPSCRMDASGKAIGAPRATRASDVEVTEAFGSSDGRKLIGMHVAPRMFRECDGPPGDFASDAWFFVPRSGRVAPLPDTRADGHSHAMALIDVGDFDGDGREEALFWYSGYNEDGYALYDRDFGRVVRFTWGYH